jgi:L-serine dehydratase
MISVFELFKIGVGPSSSHTVGPTKASAAFANGLVAPGAIDRVATVEVRLMDSLAPDGDRSYPREAAELPYRGRRALDSGQVGQGTPLYPPSTS